MVRMQLRVYSVCAREIKRGRITRKGKSKGEIKRDIFLKEREKIVKVKTQFEAKQISNVLLSTTETRPT